jgi:hypothetical protein
MNRPQIVFFYNLMPVSKLGEELLYYYSNEKSICKPSQRHLILILLPSDEGEKKFFTLDVRYV